MSTHCRCRHCRTRRALPRHPDAYKILPACRVCGRRSYHVDQWMQKRDVTPMLCNCGGSGAYVNRRGQAWPHQRGALYCHLRRDGSGRYPGDPDFRAPGMEP